MMKPARVAMALGALLPFAGTSLWAQQGSPTPAPSVASGIASLEERIAAARSVRIMTSILGVELGSELEEAHEKFDRLCAPGTRPKEEGGGEDERKREGDEHEPGQHKPGPGEEREEGHKVLWQLAGTDYSAIYITADDKERIDSITGFLRPEKQLAFDAVGDVSKAPVRDDRAVVWDVIRDDQPLFRVVARGSSGKASSVRMFLVRRPSGSAIPPKEKRDESAR